jgi:GT2 family glycosyltransferase
MSKPLNPDNNPIIFISIIIPTWNSNDYLPTCLAHLAEQTLKHFEIILVDNGSENYQCGQIPSEWPSLDIHEILLDENKGFAVACNLGARAARGEWLAFLNADAFAAPTWLEIITSAVNEFPLAGSFGSLILQDENPDLVDSAGDVYNISGMAWKGYSGYPRSEVSAEPQRIFTPCAAAVFYRRDVFLEIGGFDEDFFSYFEDVDLGFRLNLYGYQCIFLPEAIVRHVGSSSTGKQSNFGLYHYHRNMVWSYYKNMPGFLYWFYLPFHFIANLLISMKYLKDGRGKVVFKAKWDALKGIRHMRMKRRKIQRERRASALAIHKLLNKNLLTPFSIGRELRRYNRMHGSQSKQG